jgi:UDP-glucose:(heptosyl)LPS alpha-1,3-glucosyltransferase
VQTVHVVPIKYNLLHGLITWRLALRWLKIVTSPRLLVYLALEHYRFSLTRQRTIVVTSNTLLPQMRTAYPACASALQVVTPGVDRVHGVVTALQKAQARHQLGLPENGFCVLFVGNDYRKKGLETLIQAAQLLPENSYVVVVGNPAQAPQFKVQAVAAGLADRVYFLGSLKDMQAAYTVADCLAHPTHEDTFAMVVLEAMAHGLPVVVSCARYCGIAELLTHEVNALVLEDPWDALVLANFLKQLACQPEINQHLQVAGLKLASDHQWTALAQKQVRIYQELTGIMVENNV